MPIKRHPNRPFAPSKFPVFYGWMAMFAATVGVICSIPGQTIGVSVFTDYLIDALQLSRDALSSAYLIGTAMSSLFLTKAGKIYDKFGARFTAILAACTLTITLVLFSISDQMTESISSWTNISFSAISFILVSALFFLLRFSGQGVMTLASRNMLMKWFKKNRGLANSISSAIQSFGFAVAPLFVAGLIHSTDWSSAYLIMAGIIFCFIIFAYIFYRDNPEECGLIPDGKVIEEKKKKAFKESNTQFTLEEAKKKPVFWVYAIAIAFYGFFITGFTFNVISIFEIAGYDEQKALSIFIPASLISIVAAIAGNVISDYMPLKRILIVYLSGCLLSCIGLTFLSHWSGYYIMIVGNGTMGGLFSVLAAITWPRFFGRKHLGAISGLAMSLMVFGSAMAPLFFSRIFTLTGSYQLAGIIGIVLVIILLLFSLKLHNPQEDSKKG
ncbi:nitrate/nitrite transporter [Ancylomarina sp. 16SWW S1-10-2]|uniref:MFS transporter n=1 Tax=Ancylomarina sp. 16SWW S1-10-2 TaxID=2499681 RepID=UPI0012ADF36E|nr:MFS transporter [Ancylomarina sp. 16SWW S1-10-2]MRT93619.1 MFS transporter [Ancylomarina sp. 16SWW S1-10-2]